MGMELAFTIGSLLVLPFWLLMIGLPGWEGTRRLMRSPWPLIPLPVLYAVLLVMHVPLFLEILTSPGKSLLTLLADLLSTEVGATIAWIHLLAFDLFVGRWEFLDSHERRIPPLAMTPILWATFLFGPIGLLLYLAVRSLSAPPAEKSPQSAKSVAARPLRPRSS
jgi:hypothetical protein